MRIYISGAITDNANCYIQFDRAEVWLIKNDNEVVSPLKVCAALPKQFTHKEYMQVCFKLIDLCECVYMLKGWQNSAGAKAELAYAKAIGKKIKFEDKQWKFRQDESNSLSHAGGMCDYSAPEKENGFRLACLPPFSIN